MQDARTGVRPSSGLMTCRFHCSTWSETFTYQPERAIIAHLPRGDSPT